MDQPSNSTTNLTWSNVGLGFTFVLFDAAISKIFGLGVGVPLVTAAVRCIIQLAIMALVLQKIFEAENPWGVAGLTLLLNLLGTIEIIVNKAKMRFTNMFLLVLLCMVSSSMPVTVVGAILAYPIKPIWKPDEFIPLVGIVVGNTISGVVVSLDYVLKEIYDNRDKIETYLAFGATRLEACQPVAKVALRLALTPHINQMSVLGIIAIPGTMTGALLGGASVQQAARLQMVIMFMICAASALAAILVTVAVSATLVDSEHRIRTDRVDPREHWVWRARKRGWAWFVKRMIVIAVKLRVTKARDDGPLDGEGDALIYSISTQSERRLTP